MEKNDIWIWRAIDEVSRQPLGCLLGDRSDASIRKLVKKGDHGTCDFATDEWGGFFRLLPEDRHYFRKDLTFPIEDTNSDLRHRLKGFIEGQK